MNKKQRNRIILFFFMTVGTIFILAMKRFTDCTDMKDYFLTVSATTLGILALGVVTYDLGKEESWPEEEKKKESRKERIFSFVSCCLFLFLTLYIVMDSGLLCFVIGLVGAALRSMLFDYQEKI